MTRTAVFCMLFAASVAAQQPRDVAPRPIVGGARLGGTVVADDGDARPLRGAVITLTGDGLSSPISTVSDDEGRFAFDRLPAGRVNLSADKPAYLHAVFGASRPGRPGSAIALAADQQLSGVTLRMARGAVISGTLSDETGAPMRDVRVLAVLADGLVSGDAAPTQSRAVVSDDRGQYRIYGIAPGEWVVVAMASEFGNGQTERRSTEDVDAILRRLEQRQRPAAPGSTAASRDPASIDRGRAHYGFAPAFYPGTVQPADAQRVRLAPGEERTGIDFVVSPVPTAAIDGVVTDPSGQGQAVMLVINRVDSTFRPPLNAFGMTPALAMPAGSDGHFRYVNLSPGRYSIIARKAEAPVRPAQSGVVTSTPGPVVASTMWAMADLTISGEDVNIALTLQPAMKFSGRVAFDAVSDASSQQPIDSVRIGMVREGPTGSVSMNGTVMGGISVSPATVRADGTFEVAGVLPGRYRISALPAVSPAGWWMRSVIVDGRDVLDVPLEFGQAGDVTGAVATWTNRHSELTGTLQSVSGAPLMDYVVLVFPADRTMWRPGARRVKAVRPGTDGRFSLRDLPAGNYLLSALTDLEPAEADRAEFLDQVASAALPIVISDGATTRQDIRLAR